MVFRKSISSSFSRAACLPFLKTKDLGGAGFEVSWPSVMCVRFFLCNITKARALVVLGNRTCVRFCLYAMMHPNNLYACGALTLRVLAIVSFYKLLQYL
jgi:hypothetical protein